MIPLITIVDFAPFKAISDNLNTTKKLVPYIVDAQQFDIKGLLGNAFFLDLVNDIIGSPSLVKYADLWNGCEWTFGGRTYRHEGLKTVLVHYTYSRYAMNANMEETAFGIVTKKEDNSDPVSDKTIQRKIDNAKSGAASYWKDVEWFLNDNYSAYPLWNYFVIDRKKRPTVTAVQPNDRRYSLHYNRRHRRGGRYEY